MKTTMMKSMMLVGLLSVSTVMFGSTTTNGSVNNDVNTFVHHSKHCKGWDCHDKHCKCDCHKTWMGGHDKGMGGHKMDGKDMGGNHDMKGHEMDKHDMGKDMNKNGGMDKGKNNDGGMVKSGRH